MIRAENRKYHIIYKTTCITNSKFYIGLHSTDDLNDGYLGSGKKLSQSIKYYGRKNHKLEILEFISNREKLKKREAEILSEEMLRNPLCMNISKGGSDGIKTITGMGPFTGKKHTIETKNKISESVSKIKKKFIVISPAGIEYEAWMFSGFKELCNKLGISYKTLYRTLKTGKPPNKGAAIGWRLKVNTK